MLNKPCRFIVTVLKELCNINKSFHFCDYYKTRLPNWSPNSTSLYVNKKKICKKNFLLLNSYLHSIKVAHNNMGLIKLFSVALLEKRIIIPHPAGSGLNTEKDT